MRSLLAGAIAATALAICTTTPIPVIGTDVDTKRLIITLTSILWLAWFVDRRAGSNGRDIAAARAEVDQVRRLQKIEGMLQDAGQGSDFTLPTPAGDVHAIATEIDGKTVLAGVDETAERADVIDLRRAINNGNGRAAL